MSFTIEIDSIDIDVTCQNCGTDLDVYYDSHRCSLKVEPCSHCAEEKDSTISDLESKVEELEDQVSELESKVRDLENESE